MPGVKELRAGRLGIRERSVSRLGPASVASWGEHLPLGGQELRHPPTPQPLPAAEGRSGHILDPVGGRSQPDLLVGWE